MLTFLVKKKSKNEVCSECRFLSNTPRKNFKLNPDLKSKGLYMNYMNDFVFSLPNLF